METRANYLLVGGFVLVIFAGLIAFVIWFANVQFDVALKRYDVFFSGPVTGLQESSPVSYRGIRVGEVTEIRIDPDNIDRVRATIEVRADTPIRENTVASIELQSITGGSFILLSGGTQDASPLEAKPGQEHPVIASRTAGLQQLLMGAPELVDNINLLVMKARDFVSERNRDNVSKTLANLAIFSETLAGQRDTVQRLVAETTATMSDLRRTAASFEQLAATLDEGMPRVTRDLEQASNDVSGLVAELRKTAASVQSMANQIEQTVAENREPLRQFTSEGLIELINLLAELRGFVFSLQRVTREVERDPVQFLLGNQRRGYVPER